MCKWLDDELIQSLMREQCHDSSVHFIHGMEGFASALHGNMRSLMHTMGNHHTAHSVRSLDKPKREKNYIYMQQRLQTQKFSHLAPECILNIMLEFLAFLNS